MAKDASTNPKVLIVEDEEHLARGIRFNLEAEGYEVDVAEDGPGALERAASGNGFDLILLDVMLPGMDGFQVAEQLRQRGNFTPILMLTAKGLPSDVVRGLEAGADDYLPKPFDLAVLLARVGSLLRRRDWARSDTGGAAVRIGAATVNFAAFELQRGGDVIHLTLLEATLLKHLYQNAGRVVSKAEILERVWNLSPETETRAVDNFIVRLRKYIESDPRFPRHLHTVRGAGYRLVLEAPPENS